MTDPAQTNLDVFHFDDGKPSFEDLGQQNGHRWWWWSALQQLLGYELDSKAAKRAFDRAMTACTSLGIDVHENFTAAHRKDADGFTRSDFRLSRFACYLIAMNADPRKPEVAKAQAYFATVAQAAQAAQVVADGIERVAVREEVAEGEKGLSSAANRAGVQQWAFFQNAGYRGLYNMNLGQLRRIRGVPDARSPLDFMGKTELAANLFRITQTEEKIKRDGVYGQAELEETAESVGRKVRRSMIDISGTPPERLPTASDIRGVKRELKDANKHLKRLDKPKKLPKPKGE